MTAPLRIGVIGANPTSGWAARSHLPAIAAVPGLTLAAVATTRMESARVAAETFGAAEAYDSAAALVASNAVDAVVVAVRVPQHRNLVTLALEAGKPVYCEWPLGVDLAESEELAGTARARGVRTAIGLQARASPEVRFLRDAVGELGTTVACVATAYSARGADPVSASKRYLFDPAAGANLLTIETGHLLDTLAHLLGEPRDLHAVLRTRRPTVATTSGGPLENHTPDAVIATGEVGDGAPLAFQVVQGTRASEATEITVVGTEGSLRLVTTAAGGIQMAPARLFRAPAGGRFEEIPTPAHYRRTPTPTVPTAVNVAEALHTFAADLRSGSSTSPDFDTAVLRHRSIETLAGRPFTTQR
jgi:predicted dehydrogenase